MKRKQLKEAYDMNRVSRWGKRNGYELNGNVLSNGDEDITFNNDGEYVSSSYGFPSSDFEKYMNGTPASSDELIQYVGSKFGSDYRFAQAIAEYNEEAMSDIANDMSQEIDCTPEEALDAIHKVANEYAYYNSSEEDLQESAKKCKTRITKTHLKNIISESVKKALKEYYYGVKDNKYTDRGRDKELAMEALEGLWGKIVKLQEVASKVRTDEGGKYLLRIFPQECQRLKELFPSFCIGEPILAMDHAIDVLNGMRKKLMK